MKKFELLIFKFMEDMIITNEVMESGVDVLTYSELLGLLDILFLMTTITVPTQESGSHHTNRSI